VPPLFSPRRRRSHLEGGVSPAGPGRVDQRTICRSRRWIESRSVPRAVDLRRPGTRLSAGRSPAGSGRSAHCRHAHGAHMRDKTRHGQHLACARKRLDQLAAATASATARHGLSHQCRHPSAGACDGHGAECGDDPVSWASCRREQGRSRPRDVVVSDGALFSWGRSRGSVARWRCIKVDSSRCLTAHEVRHLGDQPPEAVVDVGSMSQALSSRASPLCMR